MGGMRRTVLMLVTMAVVVLVIGGAARAPSSRPVLSIVGPTDITLQLTSNGSGSHRVWTGNVILDVENDGPAVKTYRVDNFPDPTLTPGQHEFSTYVPVSKATIIRAYQVTPIPVAITLTDTWSKSLTLAIVTTSPGKVKPATVTLSLLRRPQMQDYLWPAFLALGGSLLTLVLVFLGLVRGQKKLKDFIYTTVSWSFTGNWVTVLSALGAAAATVLSATGFLSDVFPGVDVQRFFSLNVLFASLILVAPLVYAAASRIDQDSHAILGTVCGLLASSTLTLLGVGGQLAMLGMLVWLAYTALLAKVLFTVTMALVVFIIIWYSYSTIGQLIQLPPQLSDKAVEMSRRGLSPLL